jgi:hypothetical protein
MTSPDTKSPDSTSDIVSAAPPAARELLKLLILPRQGATPLDLTAPGRSLFAELPSPRGRLSRAVRKTPGPKLLSRSFPENCVQALAQSWPERRARAFVDRIVSKADLNIVDGAALVATNRRAKYDRYPNAAGQNPRGIRRKYLLLVLADDRAMDDHYSILRADRLGEPPLEFCAGAADVEHQVSICLHPVLNLGRLLRWRFVLPASA